MLSRMGELVGVGEEGGGAAGVEEDDGLVRAIATFADVGHEAGEGLGGVDRVEEEPFGLGCQPEGLVRVLCIHAVGRPAGTLLE